MFGSSSGVVLEIRPIIASPNWENAWLKKKKCFLSSWKSIANGEDVSDAVGENAARRWTHRCDHTECMRQQYLGQVSCPCGPVASGRGRAAAVLQSLERPRGWPFSGRCGLWRGFPIQDLEWRTVQGMPSDRLLTFLVGVQCFAPQWPARRSRLSSGGAALLCWRLYLLRRCP